MSYEMKQMDDLTKSLLEDEAFEKAKRDYHRSKFLVEELQRLTKTFDTDLYYACKFYTERTSELNKLEWKLRIREKLTRRINDGGSYFHKVIVVITTIVVVVSCTMVAMETMSQYNPMVYPDYKSMFGNVEVCVTIYFTLEIMFRFWVSKDKTGFFLEFLNVADVASILPYYFELLMGNTGTFRFLRFLRLLRAFRFIGSFKVFQILATASYQSAQALFGPIIFLTYSMALMSAFLFYTERGDYDPQKFMYMIDDCECMSGTPYAYNVTHNITTTCTKHVSKFHSIPHTMWWAVVTMTQVGYGDLVPTCEYGKVIASISMVIGSFFMAMPIAIVGSYFTKAAEGNVDALREKRATMAKKAAVDVVEVGFVRSPGEKLVHYLTDHLGEFEINLKTRDVPHRLKLLLEDYFVTACDDCCVECHTRAVPGQPQRFFLRRADKNKDITSAKEITVPTDTIELIAGTQCACLPDPDIVFPKFSQGILQRHAHFTQRFECGRVTPKLYVSSLSHGDTLHVNDRPVGVGGVELVTGDVINFTPHETFRTDYKVVMHYPTPE
eukprot:PhF_6_TR1459/c0_g1_i1/m.2626